MLATDLIALLFACGADATHEARVSTRMRHNDDRRGAVGNYVICYAFDVAVFLALISALVYGVGDFVGGRLSRKAPPVSVALHAELSLVVLCLAFIPALENSTLTLAAVWWGAVGGLVGALGVMGLYAALARGNMTVVAPITGVVAAVLPVIVGYITGERPAALAVAGIALAIVAVALIGGIIGVKSVTIDARTIGLAIAVGAAFGSLFIAFSRTGDTGLWPLLTSRLGGTPLLVGSFIWYRRRNAMPPIGTSLVVPGLGLGTLILISNGAYLAATREGLLSVVAVVVSMYPASTIMLAATLDKERANRPQIVGMVVAGIALVMITVAS